MARTTKPRATPAKKKKEGLRQKQKQIVNVSVGKGGASSNDYRPPTIVQVQDHYAHEAMPMYTNRTADVNVAEMLEGQRQDRADSLKERRQLMDRQFTHGLVLTGVGALTAALPLLRHGNEAVAAARAAYRAGGSAMNHAGEAVRHVGEAVGFGGGHRLGGTPRPTGAASPQLAESRATSDAAAATQPFATSAAVGIRQTRDLRGVRPEEMTPAEQQHYAGMYIRQRTSASTRGGGGGGGSASTRVPRWEQKFDSD